MPDPRRIKMFMVTLLEQLQISNAMTAMAGMDLAEYADKRHAIYWSFVEPSADNAPLRRSLLTALFRQSSYLHVNPTMSTSGLVLPDLAPGELQDLAAYYFVPGTGEFLNAHLALEALIAADVPNSATQWVVETVVRRLLQEAPGLVTSCLHEVGLSSSMRIENFGFSKAAYVRRFASNLTSQILFHNDYAVVRLADAIYRGEKLFAIPLLADALEEAGYPSGFTALNHCRNEFIKRTKAFWVVEEIRRKAGLATNLIRRRPSMA